MEVDLLLQTYCKRLKLPTFAHNYHKFAQEAAQANQTSEQYLLALLEQEVIQRETNQERRRIQAARFPILRTLDTFDFSAVPTLNKAKILELARGEYITKCENILFVGEIGIVLDLVAQSFDFLRLLGDGLLNLLLVEEHGLLRIGQIE